MFSKLFCCCAVLISNTVTILNHNDSTLYRKQRQNTNKDATAGVHIVNHTF